MNGARPSAVLSLIDPALLATAVVWGLNMPLLKELLVPFSAAGLLTVRYVVMTALLAIALPRLQTRPWPRLRHWPELVIIGLVGLGIQQWAFMVGLTGTTSAEGALLLGTAPIFATLIACATGVECVRGRNWLGVGLAFLGIGLVLLGGAHAAAEGGARLMGNLLVLGAALLYGGYAVVSKRLMDEHGAPLVVTVGVAMVALLSLPLGVRDVLNVHWAGLGWHNWGSLAFIAIPGGAISFVVWYNAVRRHGPSKTMAYQYLVPVVALSAGVAFRHERIAPPQWLGAAITLVGIGLARWRPALLAEGPNGDTDRRSGGSASGPPDLPTETEVHAASAQ
jgi:drug/metabolite transporter (DMT)-like permease